MKKALNDINNDILPSMLDYNKPTGKSLDLDKVSYFDHNSVDKVSNTFSSGWDSIPNFEKVIKNIADGKKSPLDEMNDRIKKSEDEINDRNNEILNYESSKGKWVDFSNFDLLYNK
jgi:hypothetical protein